MKLSRLISDLQKLKRHRGEMEMDICPVPYKGMIMSDERSRLILKESGTSWQVRLEWWPASWRDN